MAKLSFNIANEILARRYREKAEIFDRQATAAMENNDIEEMVRLSNLAAEERRKARKYERAGYGA